MISGMMKIKTEDDNSELVLSCDQMGESMLKSAVLGQSMKELTYGDYEEYLNKRMRATKRPIEDIRREYTLVCYLTDTYTELFTDAVEEYTLRKLKEYGEELGGKKTI